MYNRFYRILYHLNINKYIKTLIIIAYNIDKITFNFGIIAVVDFKFSIQTYLSFRDFLEPMAL